MSRFCPNCGSESVEPDTRHTNILGEAIFNQNKWLCNECGYTGLMPEEDLDVNAEEMDELEFEPQDQPTIDTDAGKGYVDYILYAAIPLILLYILYIILT